MRRGFTYVRERVVLQRLIAAEAVAFLFFALVLPIEVAFAKDTLDAGDFGYGLLLAAWGTGMVIGSILFSSLRQVPLPTLLFIGTLASASRTSATAVVPHAGARVRGVGDRRRRERGPMGGGGDRVQEPDHRPVPGAGDRTAGVAGERRSPGAGFLIGGVIAAASRRARATPWRAPACSSSWRSRCSCCAACAGSGSEEPDPARGPARERCPPPENRGALPLDERRCAAGVARLSPRRPRRRGPSRPRSARRSRPARPAMPGAAGPCRRRRARWTAGSGTRRRRRSSG